MSIQIGKLYLNLCVQFFNLNCFCKILYYICCCFCLNKKKNQNKKKNEVKLDKKSTSNFSYNNKVKNDYLNESNYNMISINNYLYLNDNNIILDYNQINMANITIEDVMDVKFQIDENNIKYNNNKLNLLYNKFPNDNKDNKKNISMIESFNNLNNIS